MVLAKTLLWPRNTLEWCLVQLTLLNCLSSVIKETRKINRLQRSDYVQILLHFKFPKLDDCSTKRLRVAQPSHRDVQ